MNFAEKKSSGFTNYNCQGETSVCGGIFANHVKIYQTIFYSSLLDIMFSGLGLLLVLLQVLYCTRPCSKQKQPAGSPEKNTLTKPRNAVIKIKSFRLKSLTLFHNIC